MQKREKDYRDAGQFTVGGWVVDPGAHTIVCGSTSKRLEPKAMQVLVYMADHAGSVVTRNELEESVWTGMVVGYDALSNTIIKIRKAFSDPVAKPNIIQTIPKSGYRLIAPVGSSGVLKTTTVDVRHDPELNILSAGAGPILPQRPSIAILRFNNLAGGAVEEYFCDGLAEDIILDLSKLSGLFVIASNSSFAEENNKLNPQVICRSLGVRYIVLGNVRQARSDIRISLQLIDGESGVVVWGERYDMQANGLFDFQDNVRRDIVEALKLGISSVENSRLTRRSTENEEAYHYFLHGRELDRCDNKAANYKARELFQYAIVCDSQFSDAHSYLSRNLAVCFINRWSDKLEGMLQSAIDAAQTAIALDNSSAHAHFALGASTLWVRQHEAALKEAEYAISLDPNFAEGLALRGMIQMYSGKPSEAVLSLQAAMRLDPFFRDAYLHIIAQAYFHAAEYTKAVQSLKSRLIRKPDSDTSRVLLAAAYAHQGLLEQSRTEWQYALEINPDYCLEHKREIMPYLDPKDFNQIQEGLNKAGVL